MRIYATLIALVIAGAVSCGTDKKEKNLGSTSVAVSDANEIKKLDELAANVPQRVLTRVPVVNGKPDFSKIEAIKVTQSIDYKNAKAMDSAFEGASASDRIKDISDSESLDENSSTDQWCCGRWRYRGFRVVRPVVVAQPYAIAYSAGYNNCFRPYQYVGGCCQQQPVPVPYAQPQVSCGGCGGGYSTGAYGNSSTYQYGYYQSSSSGGWQQGQQYPNQGGYGGYGY